MALDPTVGGASSNTYATLLEADGYLAERMYSSDWSSATDPDKEKALVTAARRLDQEEFDGFKSSTTQALKWPRSYTYDQDGNPYASDAIPTVVKYAQIELALSLIESNALKQSKLTNFTHVKIGPLDLTPKQPQSSGSLPALVRAHRPPKGSYVFQALSHEDSVYLVAGVTKDISAAAAAELKKRIRARLHNSALTVTGYTVQLVSWLQDVEYTERDDDGETFQIEGGLYEVLVEPS